MSLHATKASRKRLSLIEEANANALSNRIKELETEEAKRRLIAESNPLLYLFGYALNPKTYLETYTGEENESN